MCLVEREASTFVWCVVGQLTVAGMAGHQVEVQMKHLLPCRSTVGLQDADAGGVQPRGEQERCLVECTPDRRDRLRSAVIGQVVHVAAWNDEGMPGSQRIDVEERTGTVIVVDEPRRSPPCRDGAKDAGVTHAHILSEGPYLG